MSTTTISDLANKTPSGSMYTVIEDSGSTGKTTINNLVSSADIIGSTSMGTTATTITGAIAEHEADLTELNGKLSTIIGYKTVEIGTVTILSGGYLSLNSYRPAAPTGYSFMFAMINGYTSTTAKTAFTVTDDGTWLIGTGGDTITGLKVDYYYIRTGCVGRLT